MLNCKQLHSSRKDDVQLPVVLPELTTWSLYNVWLWCVRCACSSSSNVVPPGVPHTLYVGVVWDCCLVTNTVAIVMVHFLLLLKLFVGGPELLYVYSLRALDCQQSEGGLSVSSCPSEPRLVTFHTMVMEWHCRRAVHLYFSVGVWPSALLFLPVHILSGIWGLGWTGICCQIWWILGSWTEGHCCLRIPCWANTVFRVLSMLWIVVDLSLWTYYSHCNNL